MTLDLSPPLFVIGLSLIFIPWFLMFIGMIPVETYIVIWLAVHGGLLAVFAAIFKIELTITLDREDEDDN